MDSYLQLADYLSPINMALISDDESYEAGQIGKKIAAFENLLPDISEANVVLIGCAEQRGSRQLNGGICPADAVRKQLYKLYHWHADIVIADLGNIILGSSYADTLVALEEVLSFLYEQKKLVLVIGGSHDLTLAQYKSIAKQKIQIEAVCADALIDVKAPHFAKNENFLMQMLTAEPNYVKHYSHIGFQSYFLHPGMIETLDKLRFDCYRLGHVRENINDMEPVLRNAHLFSFDLTAIANAFAPANKMSPNGLQGDEACQLMQYAGMGSRMSSIGIYGFNPTLDENDITAMQISQMIWYMIDGKQQAQKEAALHFKDEFNEFHFSGMEVDIFFLQSKRTGRWWMQLPSKEYIACSYSDYVSATHNEMPERFLRTFERT